MEPKGISGLFSPFVKKFRIRSALKYINYDSKILDIGCGFGEIIGYLPDTVEYTGIEKDEYLFKYCKEKYPEREILKADVEEIIDKLEKEYDILLFLSVIEHLKDPLYLLKSLRKILKEKGKILIYTPSPKAKNLIWFGSKLGILSKVALEEHQSLFHSRDLIENLKKIGFKLVLKKNFFLGLSYFLVFEK